MITGNLREVVSYLEGQTFIDRMGIGIYFSKNYIEIFDDNANRVITEIDLNAEDIEEEEE